MAYFNYVNRLDVVQGQLATQNREVQLIPHTRDLPDTVLWVNQRFEKACLDRVMINDRFQRECVVRIDPE